MRRCSAAKQTGRGRATLSREDVIANPSRSGVDFVEYLRFEQEAAERHELIDGEIVAMAGASRRHNLICGRLHDAIRPPLGDGPCVLERSDQRLASRFTALTRSIHSTETRACPRVCSSR